MGKLAHAQAVVTPTLTLTLVRLYFELWTLPGSLPDNYIYVESRGTTPFTKEAMDVIHLQQDAYAHRDFH